MPKKYADWWRRCGPHGPRVDQVALRIWHSMKPQRTSYARFAASPFRSAELRERTLATRDAWLAAAGPGAQQVVCVEGGGVDAPPYSPRFAVLAARGSLRVIAPDPPPAIVVPNASALDVLPASKPLIVCGSTDGLVHAISADSLATIGSARFRTDSNGPNGSVLSIACHRTALVVAAGTDNGSAGLVDVGTSSLRTISEFVVSQRGATVQSIGFSECGSMLATTSKDNIIRLFDPRSYSPLVAATVPVHNGARPSKVMWLNRSLDTMLLSTGSSRTLDRECALWDARSMREPVLKHKLDTSIGSLIPLYDPDSSLLFLTGKGDTTIRTFEVSSTVLTPVSQTPFVFSKPVIDACLVRPKSLLNIMDCEVARVMVLTGGGSTGNDCSLVPVNVTVPRQYKMDFQIDLFPDTIQNCATLLAEKWITGENSQLVKVSLDPNRPQTQSVCDSRVIAQIVPAQQIPESPSPSASPSLTASSRPSSPSMGTKSRPPSFISPRSIDALPSLDMKINRPATPSRLSQPPIYGVNQGVNDAQNDLPALNQAPQSPFSSASAEQLESILSRLLDEKLETLTKKSSRTASLKEAEDGPRDTTPQLLTAVLDKLDALTQRLVHIETAVPEATLAAVRQQTQAAATATRDAVDAALARVDAVAARVDAVESWAAASLQSALAGAAAAQESMRTVMAGVRDELAGALDARVADAVAAVGDAVRVHGAAVGETVARETAGVAGRVEVVVREVGDAVQAAVQAAVANANAQVAAVTSAASQQNKRSSKILQVPNMGITTQLSKLKELAMNNIVGGDSVTQDKRSSVGSGRGLRSTPSMSRAEDESEARPGSSLVEFEEDEVGDDILAWRTENE
ncbi:Coronin-7 [Entophlyctis luteolus]|nr:Coronin-7 [Entophlyctis luteolus]